MSSHKTALTLKLLYYIMSNKIGEEFHIDIVIAWYDSHLEETTSLSALYGILTDDWDEVRVS